MYPFEKKYQTFILGHMRSRSTLLAHILMDSKEIYGFGETNKVYKNKLDFIKMRVKTRIYNNANIPIKYIYLDQINHNQKTPNIALLKAYVKPILLVRTPEESFESIRKLTRDFYTEWSHKKIENYYLKRLEFLLTLKSNTLPDQRVIINSQELITNPQKSLHKISTFLNLKTPLSSNYTTYNFTGKHGDPSSIISSGKITKTTSNVYDKEISEECFSLFKAMFN